jgi:hypothetical protein
VNAAEKKSRLWVWFVAAFLIQLGAWTAWFMIASQHKVAEVPLAGAASVEH